MMRTKISEEMFSNNHLIVVMLFLIFKLVELHYYYLLGHFVKLHLRTC